MTDKETIIDGIDVSECGHYHYEKCEIDYDEWNNEIIRYNECQNNPNCYFKQLKRKEQECERLKDELSTYGATGICETCTAKSVLQNDKYTKVLREIKDIAEQQVPYINLDQVKTCTEVEYDYLAKVWNLEQRMYNILQKISEVNNDR